MITGIADILNAARLDWSLGDKAATLIAERENRVFRIKSDHGPVALRVHRPGYRTTSEIESELTWMSMLEANGIGVPRALPASNGSRVRSYNGVSVSVLSWVDGVPLGKSPVSTSVFESLGRVLARMHAVAEVWVRPVEFCRPKWDLAGDHPTWGRFWDNPELSVQQKSVFTEFRDAARHSLESLEEMDHALIHADLVPDNVLCNDGRLFLIDFDDGGFGHQLFDLATITQSCRRRFGREDLARAAVAGYCRDRDVDTSSLLLFEALRSCSYVGWNIARLQEADGFSRNARFVSEAQIAIDRFFSQ